MLERALSLRAPELVGWNVHLAQTVGFLPNFWHLISPSSFLKKSALVFDAKTKTRR